MEEEGYDYQYPQEEIEEGEEQYQPADYPIPKPGESLYTLFNNVLRLKDNSKVANLDKTELGDLRISVRDCQRVSLIANTLHHPIFGDFFNRTAEIVLTTSASKKGWFTELFVSQKRLSAKTTTTAQQLVQPPKARRWPFKKQQVQ